jgi:hypothetical protein
MRTPVLLTILIGLIYSEAQATTPFFPAATSITLASQQAAAELPAATLQAVPVPRVESQSLSPPAAPTPPPANPPAILDRLTDWLLALFIALLAAGSYWQLKFTRQALIATNRAFVFVKDCNVSPVDGGSTGSMWNVDFLLENTGNTPTKKMIAPIVWMAFPVKIPDDFYLADINPKEKKNFKLIGPRQVITASAEELPVGVLVDASHGAHRILAWGWAEYNDVFKGMPRHRTEFCFEIKVAPDFSKRGKYAVEPVLYHKHNGADEECLIWPAKTA